MRAIYPLFFFFITHLLNGQTPLELSVQTFPAYCGLATGAIQLSVSGGNGVYQYLWSDGNTMEDRSAVPPGSYQVTVSDQLGATATISAVVADSVFQPQVNAIVLPNTACQFPNGSVTLEIWPPANYSYFWSNATTVQNQVGLDGGVVAVTITEGQSCFYSLEFVVEEQPLFPEFSLTTTHSICETYSGAIDLEVTSGQPPFSYQWSSGHTTSDLQQIFFGNYWVTVTGSNGCSRVQSVFVENDTIEFSLQAVVTPNTHCSQPNGHITVEAIPAGIYTWYWGHGPFGPSIGPLAAGQYELTISAGGACTQTAVYVVENQPDKPLVAWTIDTILCHGDLGGIDVSVLNGEAPFVYEWSNDSIQQDLLAVPAGMYGLTVTGANQCADTIWVSLSEPAPLIHQAFATNETAPGAQDGTAGCLPAGGVAPYQVLWSTGDTVWTITGLSPGVYSLTITDQNACTVSGTVYVSAFGCALEPVFYPTNLRCYGDDNGKVYLEINNGTPPFQYQWSNGDTTQYPKQLTAGWYLVTVADAANCFGQYAVPITEPPLLEVTIDEVQQVACGGQSGAAWFSVQGGTPPYLPVGANGIFENLGVGYYTIIITDSKNCTATASFGVVEEPDTLAPLISCPPNQVVCGPAPVVYDLPAVTDNCPGHSLALITGLEPGNAFPVGTIINTWEVVDWAGNTASCSFSITTLEQPTVSLLALGHDFNGLGTGFITVTVTGGALEYQWTKDGQPYSMASDLVGISAGVYSLTVTAGNGCTAVLEHVEVLQTSGLEEQEEQNPVRMQPNPGGDQVQLTAEGSGLQMIQLYNYCGQPVWRQDLDGAATATLQVEELPAGVYWVWVRVGDGQFYRLSWVKQ